LQKLNKDGISGLAHASRGQPGHRRHDEAVKSECFEKFQRKSDVTYNLFHKHS